MAKNGLDATSYRGWILNNIEIDEFTNLLFSEFVIGTPAFNLSQKGRDLYSYYEFKTIADYDKLKLDLIGSIPFSSFETYEKLKDGISNDIDMNFTNHPPVVLNEKIYMYAGSVRDNKFYKQYFITTGSTKGKNIDTIHSEALTKKNIVDVEKLFYHLRNGLAHGCFSAFEQNGNVYYIIQDESNDGIISARMVLEANTLQTWIDYLKVRKETISSSITTAEEQEIHEETEKEAS